MLPEYNYLEKEGYITGLLEVTDKEVILMDIYSSRESFGFARDAIGSTRRRTIFNKLAVIVLQKQMTSLFVSLDMFSPVVPFLFYFDSSVTNINY